MDVKESFVIRLIRASQEIYSLNTPIGHEKNGNALTNLVADIEANNPMEKAQNMALYEKIKSDIMNLSPRQRDVLRMHFGLDNVPKRTLEEIGRHFKFTREYIRQIEKKALKRLRQSYTDHELQDHK
jgi:RNA polymerase primary sigma factor